MHTLGYVIVLLFYETFGVVCQIGFIRRFVSFQTYPLQLHEDENFLSLYTLVNIDWTSIVVERSAVKHLLKIDLIRNKITTGATIIK